MNFDNHGKATFSWKSNTTDLFLTDHVFNITIITPNGTIVQQQHNIQSKEVECPGLEQYTNYTFTIQSKNKYTYALESIEHQFKTYGVVYVFSNLYK